jgi:hypothetical protein
MVRISPKEVSIATPEAMATIYAFGNKMMKSNFYHAVCCTLFEEEQLEFISSVSFNSSHLILHSTQLTELAMLVSER